MGLKSDRIVTLDMNKRKKKKLPYHGVTRPPVKLAETENQQNGAGQRETVPRPRRNARCKVNGAPRHVGIGLFPHIHAVPYTLSYP